MNDNFTTVLLQFWGILLQTLAPVAQLDRALASGAEGPAFESRRARLKFPVKLIGFEARVIEGIYFTNYAIADGLYNLLFGPKTCISAITKAKKPEFQLYFSFWQESG